MFRKDPPVKCPPFLIFIKSIILRCEWPGCHKRAMLHSHHIHGRGFGGGKRKDTPEEVIVLCHEHHAYCHSQGLSQKVQGICYEAITHRSRWEKRELDTFLSENTK